MPPNVQRGLISAKHVSSHKLERGLDVLALHSPLSPRVAVESACGLDA